MHGRTDARTHGHTDARTDPYAHVQRCATFWLWNRALRGADAEDGKDASQKSRAAPVLSATFFGIMAGCAYVGMAASWGGYVFVRQCEDILQ